MQYRLCKESCLRQALLLMSHAKDRFLKAQGQREGGALYIPFKRGFPFIFLFFNKRTLILLFSEDILS